MSRAVWFPLGVMVLCCIVLSMPSPARAEGDSATVTSFSQLARLAGLEVQDPGFRLSSLEIHLRIDPAGRLFQAEYLADLHLLAERLPDIENWVFWPAESVTEVTIGGTPVSIRPGVQAPGFEAFRTISLPLRQALPTLARGSVTGLVIKTEDVIPAEEEVARYGIVQDLLCPVAELSALLSPGSRWKLMVTVPEGWSAISQGEPLGEKLSEDGEEITFGWSVPVSKMAANFMVVVGPYSRVELDLPGDIGLWLLEEDMGARDDLAAAVAEVVKRANQVMSGRLGMPALERLEIVKVSQPGKNVSGKGPRGLVLVEYGREVPFKEEAFLQTLSHEVCHQWFPGRVDLDFSTALWLSESMATYFDARHLRDQWPPVTYFADHEGYQPLPHSINEVTSNLATMPWSTKSRVIYIRGAWVVNMLREMMGDEAFGRTLQRFYTPGPAGLKGTLDFQAIAEEESGLDLDRFFEQWLGTATTPKLTLENVTVHRTTEGWQVRGTVTNQFPMPLPPVTVSVVRSGTQLETVTIALPDIPEQSVQQADFEITAPSLFTRVVLDPDANILNIAESATSISLFRVWAGQPAVILGAVLMVAATCALALAGYGKRRRSGLTGSE